MDGKHKTTRRREKRIGLHRSEPDGMVTRRAGLYWVASGPAISAKGRTLFYTDSGHVKSTSLIFGCRGELANKPVDIRFPAEMGLPTG